MLKIIYSLVLLLLSAITTMLFGQTNTDKITISGVVTSEATVSNAIVYLLSSEKIVKTEFPNEIGNFMFENVPIGNYSVKVTANGLKDYIGDSFEASENVNLGNITLTSEVNVLKEVVVAKSRPYIERQQGKMILNVDSSIGSTGSSAFEVLEKAPGVNVDNSDNISLRGRGGIIVQIDGKPTPMSGTNLANYLRGIPSGSVDKIEFITNPGAKYDASGTSIINIKLKKDRKRGTNGTVSTSYGQGRYPKSNNSLSLNHRNKNVNIFGTYSFAYREWFNELLLKRNFYGNGVFLGAYDQNNWLKMNFRNHIARAGMDYSAGKKHTFGVTAGAVSNKFNPTGKNISDVYNGDNIRESKFTTNNQSRDNWHNNSVNLNHKFAIDTLGTELTTDFDYADFGNKTQQNFTTRYFDTNNVEFQNPYLLDGNLNGNLDIFAIKSDFAKTLKSKFKFETGIKASHVTADNDLQFYDLSSGTPIFDETKSNHFIYKENINAGYVNLSRDYEKWGFTLGLRVENTNIVGEQLIDNTSFTNRYTQLFPSALASYKLNAKNGLELNYSRRISRPSYDQLNPFKFYLDPTTYKEGNPFLKPQTTHALELTHIFNQKVYTTLSFSRTTDNITQVIAPSETDPQLTVQTEKNLDTVDVFGLFAIIPYNVTEWWSMNNSLNFYYGLYSGTVANTTLESKGNFTYNCNSVNSFKLGNGFTAEMTGNYRAREIYAFMDVDPIWYLNIGLQKKFKNSVIKLAVNDVFYTNNTTADTEFVNYKESFDVRRETRVAILSYTYNFGQSNSPQRRRTGGADDIKQRAGSNG